MTDIAPDPFAGEPAETAPPPPGAVAPPAAPPPGGSTAGSSDQYLDNDLPDQPLFDIAFVRGLRESGARYRTAAREAEAKVAAYGVFDQYEPDDRQVWIDLANTWMQSPEEAARIMAEIAQNVLGEPSSSSSSPSPGSPSTEPPAATAPPEAGNLTAERVQELIQEAMAGYQKSVAEQQAVDQVFAEIRQAGIEPESDDGFMVLWYANNRTEGDIPKALELVKAKRQAIIDDYVHGRTTQPRAGVAPSNGAVATSQSTHQDSWEETRRAAQAFVNSQPGQ